MSTNIFPAGKYLTRAKEWAIAEGKSAPQAFISFEEVAELGRPPAYYGSFSDAALPFTMKALRACGWAGSDLSELEHAQCGMDSNQVEIVVDHEVYEGVTRAKVKWVNAPGAGVTPMAADKKASFVQQMKAKILLLEQGQPKTASRNDGPPPGHPAHADSGPSLP